MTVHEMLELLQTLLGQRRDGIVGLKSVTRQGEDWLKVDFENGQSLTVMVDELV